jgi:hypothetical protein
MAPQSPEARILADLSDVKSTETDRTVLRIAAEVTAKTDSDSEKHDVESTEDGHFNQYIERDGKHILVNWTKEEEARVVRKADFLFLPLFTVCIRRPSPKLWEIKV